MNSPQLPDSRLPSERPDFTVRQAVEKQKDGTEHVRYEVEGNLSAPVPPIRDSMYLDRKQCIEIYRYMLLNRKMEIGLENLYKQGKVVGGVYFGLGQEACSCASAYALDKNDWFAPMIRNQGALLVRGFRASDTMMQYMAKADSPTKGRDGTSHFGDIEKRNMVSPISMLGDLIPVLAGVALVRAFRGATSRRSPGSAMAASPPALPMKASTSLPYRSSAWCSSSKAISGPTPHRRRCNTACKTWLSAPSHTAFRA